jgi:hypothetical protein
MTTEATATEVPTTVKVGDPVISMRHGTSIYTYGGYDEDRSGMESLRIGIGSGQRPVLKCDPERVAPEALLASIPAKDDRVTVRKRTTQEARAANYYGRGSWSYTIPGVDFEMWADTKRDALAEGAQRLAIAAWHEREDTSVDLTDES